MARPCRPGSLPATELGAALRRAREKAKLTQQAAAAALGVKQASVSGWERGSDAPRADRLSVIASTYSMSEARLRALWIGRQIAKAA